MPFALELPDRTPRAALSVPFLDLVPSAGEQESWSRACARVIASGRFIGGAEVGGFEHAAAAFLRAEHAVGCSSGSDALVIALLALGIGRGDEVILPGFSFFATAESVVRVGAVPRFVDIELELLALEPEAVAAAIGGRTRAVLVVHIAGAPAPMDDLRRVTEAHGIALVEDAAQAFGSTLNGRRLGTFGHAGCFSFQATKPLGALGDAGMVVSGDARVAERCRQLTVHGAPKRHEHASIGGNFRLDAMQAAILREKLAHFEETLARREAVARAYDEGLRGVAEVTCPKLPVGALSNRALYTIRVEAQRRDALVAFLAERGIETSVYYPMPLSRQPALLELGLGLPQGALPNCERACREVLSLPIYPSLTREQIERVIEGVRAFFER
ncbi:MAG: DegT/DnrJ/EryC1/StrS family aminotransferase [Myxococcota bacterium]